MDKRYFLVKVKVLVLSSLFWFFTGGCAKSLPQLSPASETALPAIRITETSNVPSQNVTPVTTDRITSVPIGEFLLLWYPPLKMHYAPSQWTDKSNYVDNYILVNYLQSLILETCKITVSGPTEFNYPHESEIVLLGKVQYEKKRFEDMSTAFYIENGSLDNYDYDQGFPILIVSASQAEFDECVSLSERVLSSLQSP